MTCSDCKLGEGASINCICSEIPEKPRVIVVGGSPSYAEEATGRPFNGKTGKLLTELLTEAGLKREQVHLTYAIKCFKPDTKISQTDLKACSPKIKEEIAASEAEVVVVMGAVAMKAIFGKSSIKDYQGSSVEMNGKTYFFTLDPGIIFRQPQLWSLMKTHFTRLRSILGGEIEGENVLHYTLVNTTSKLVTCLKSLEKSKVISYDIETTGLSIFDESVDITVIGFGVKDHQWIVPFNHPQSPWRDNRKLQTEIFDALMNRLVGKITVAQNGKFDNKMMYTRYGNCPSLTFDTMLASYMLDENAPHDLKSMARLYYNAPDYALDAHGCNEENLTELAKYNAFDVYYTRKLYFTLKEKLLEDGGTYRVFRHILMPCSKVFQEIEMHGVYIDPENFKSALERNREEVAALLSKLNDMVDYKINWNSTQQVGKLLFEELQLPILEYTPTGNPSTSGENVLPRLRDQHPVVQALLDYREKVKLGQFLTSWESLMIDNRLHPNFLLHGTVTGRISCKEPNIQQVPRDVTVRSLISAPPGWTLVEFDYSQAELRIAAMMSGDNMMKLCFQTGIDIHAKTASSVMGVPVEKVKKDERKKAKAVNFGFVYGMSFKKFKDYARDKYGVIMTMEEARESRERFFETYPGLIPWHDRQRRLVSKYGYVRSLIGRKRNLPEIFSIDQGIKAEAERQAINSPVQSLGSDLNLFSLCRIRRTLPYGKCKPIGTVHDAILIEIRNDFLEEAVPIIVDLMTDSATVEKTFSTKFTVPIDVEGKAGPWGKGTVVYNDTEGIKFDEIEKLAKL